MSSGYGVELTVESMWDETWDTTKFGHWNATIGTLFNAAILGTAGTDTANTDVVEELKAQTHLIFAQVQAMRKSNTLSNPWDLMADLMATFVGNRFEIAFSRTIERCQELLSKRHHIKFQSIEFSLRSHGD